MPAARSKSSVSGIFTTRCAGSAIAEYAVADAKPAHAGADAFDDAGELGGRRERERRLELVFAGDDQRVEEIERRRLDGDDDLAITGNRIGQLGEFKIVGAAEVRAENGFHESTLCRGNRVRQVPRLRHAGLDPAIHHSSQTFSMDAR